MQSIRRQERVAVLAHPHWIYHQRTRETAELVDDGQHQLLGAQHAGLDGVGADVVEDRTDLGAYGIHRKIPDRLNAQRILSGDGSDRGHPVDAEREHGL
jgi:hypothetical protein